MIYLKRNFGMEIVEIEKKILDNTGFVTKTKSKQDTRYKKLS